MAEKRTTLKTPEEIAEQLGLQVQEPKQPVSADPVERAIEEEIQKEVQFGDRAGTAAVTGALSGATLGLSDQFLTDVGAFAPEELKEIRERSPLASGLGETAGAVGSVFIPGAPLAKVSQVAGVAGKQLGKEALKATASAGVKNKFAKKAAKEISELGLVGAAEGAAIGAGEAVSEAALANKPLTAEEIVASTGFGALTGGFLGGALGLGSASIPTVKKGIGGIAKKISGKTKALTDPDEAMKAISGLSPKQVVQTEARDPEFFSKLRNYMSEEIQPNAFTSREVLAKRNTQAVDRVGAEIGKTVKELDEAATLLQATPQRQDFYQRLVGRAESITSRGEEFLGEAASALNEPIKKMARKWTQKSLEDAPLTLNEINGLKKALQEFAYKNKNVPGSGAAEVADQLRYFVKQEIDSVADKVSQQAQDQGLKTIADRLKTLNEKFYVGKKVEDSLLLRAERAGGPGLRDLAETGIAGYFGGVTGLALGGLRSMASSDFARRAIAFRQVAKQQQAVNNKINSTVKSFLDPAKRGARVASNVVLLKSQLARSENGKTPETKQKAYENIKTNIEALKNNPELLMERLAVAQGPLSRLNPQLAQLAAETQTKALMYIAQNLPIGPQNIGTTLFPREYQPSELQLAKFERILQVAEAPLSVMDDLQNGELTRDHVKALQNIYPELYNKIRTEFAFQLPEMSSKVTYQQKLQLGVLFNLPTDAALQPQALIELQNNFATSQQQQAADESVSAVRPTVGAMGSMDFSGRAATGVQNVLNRVTTGQ